MPAFETNGADLKYPEWQKPLQDAIVELDESKLPRQLDRAEAAILGRQQAIVADPNHREERQAIQDALAILRAFKRNHVAFPGCEQK